MSQLLDSIDSDLKRVFFNSETSFAILAGWYPMANPDNAKEVDIVVFIDDVVLQEAELAVEGQEIRVQGVEAEFRPNPPAFSYDVDYDDVLVWTDRVTKQANAYRIKSIQPDGTGVIEFIVAEARDIVV